MRNIESKSFGVQGGSPDIRGEDEKAKKEKASFLRYDEQLGQLFLCQDGRFVAVQVKPCFPWTAAGEFISLINDEGETLRVVENIQLLSNVEADALARSLMQAEFMFEITEVQLIEEEFELRSWTVQTKQGARKFQTGVDDWPRELKNASFLIEDVSGDLYLLKRNVKIHKRAKAAIAALID